MIKRKQELSALNILLWILVVLIHILSFPVSVFPLGSIKYNLVMVPWRLSSFAVQGFVLLSGLKMFLTRKYEMPYFQYLKKRFFSIVIPYLICCAVYYAFYIIEYNYPFDIAFFIKSTLNGKIASHFYFIPLIIQFDLLMPLWRKIIISCSPKIIVPAFLPVSIVFETCFHQILAYFKNTSFALYNDRFFMTYVTFWIIGCYIGKYYNEFSKFAKKYYNLIFCAFTASLIICAVFSVIAFNKYARVPYMNLIHYVYVICTIIFLLAATQKTSALDNICKTRLFAAADRLSYSIYLWHMLVLYAANVFVMKFGLAMQSLAFIFRVIFVYFFTFIFALFLEFTKNKIVCFSRKNRI